MPKFSRKELIDQGFMPASQRATMVHPFSMVDQCTPSQYEKLPADIQSKFEAATVSVGQRGFQMHKLKAQ